jgi:hypothetical protein
LILADAARAIVSNLAVERRTAARTVRSAAVDIRLLTIRQTIVASRSLTRLTFGVAELVRRGTVGNLDEYGTLSCGFLTLLQHPFHTAHHANVARTGTGRAIRLGHHIGTIYAIAKVLWSIG